METDVRIVVVVWWTDCRKTKESTVWGRHILRLHGGDHIFILPTSQYFSSSASPTGHLLASKGTEDGIGHMLAMKSSRDKKCKWRYDSIIYALTFRFLTNHPIYQTLLCLYLEEVRKTKIIAGRNSVDQVEEVGGVGGSSGSPSLSSAVSSTLIASLDRCQAKK